jgi:hypothetical protein
MINPNPAHLGIRTIIMALLVSVGLSYPRCKQHKAA